MVRLRGGVSAINHFHTIQRVITWFVALKPLLLIILTFSRADFCFSSTWGLPLAFPILHSLSSTLPTSDSLLFESIFQYKDFGYFNIVQPSTLVLEILSLLQSVSQAISTCPRDKTERVLVANSIYAAEHKLLSLSAGADRIHSAAIDISECLRSAALLYLHLAIRQIPLRAQRHRRLIETLHASLPLDRDLSVLSAPEISLRLLLWVLFIGAVTAFESPNHPPVINQLVQVGTILRIKTLEDFKSSLQKVMWIEPFCGLHCVTVWNDMHAPFRA
jgi:hypothetical protein